MNSIRQVDLMVADWKAQGLPKSQIVVNKAIAMLEWAYVWGAVGAQCTVAKREYYMGRSAISSGDIELIKKRCQVLNGSKGSCTGCKYYPNEERTEINDCQGFVKRLHSAVGITLNGGGCTSMWNDSRNWAEKGVISNMPKDKVCCVFKYISSTGKMDHIGEHIGDGKIIHCSGEVKYGSITEKGWTHYAIPKGLDGGVPVEFPTLRKGSKGEYVTLLQTKLIQQGYDLSPYGADGSFGNKTLEAVKQFQTNHGLKSDGIVGAMTWSALNAGETTYYTVTIPHLAQGIANEIVTKYGGTMTKEGA